MEKCRDYFAFISYKREDEKFAKWLQHKLEYYHFPTNLNGRDDLPKYIRPTFRDVTDLNPGVLADEIYNALNSSEWLIVVCSPRSAQSIWVCKEAQTFIDLGRGDHIIPFIIEGVPFSKDPTTECYPESLLNIDDDKELLAANINEMGRDAAVIKVIARMFGIRFDILWQRHKREEKAIKIKMKKERLEMLASQSRTIAYVAKQQIEFGNTYLAARLLLSSAPSNLERRNRPLVPEVIGGLRLVYDRLNYSTKFFPICYFPTATYESSIISNGDILCYTAIEGVCVYRLRDGKRIKVLNVDQDGPIGLAFSHSGTLLAKSTSRGFEIWETTKWKCMLRETFDEYDGILINHIAFGVHDDKLVLTSHDYSSVIIYNLRNKHYSFIGKDVEFPIISAINHAENTIAIVDNINEVSLYSTKGKHIGNYSYEESFRTPSCHQLHFSSDDKLLLFCSDSDFLQAIDLTTGDYCNVDATSSLELGDRTSVTLHNAYALENELLPLFIMIDISKCVDRSYSKIAKENYELIVYPDKQIMIGRNSDKDTDIGRNEDRSIVLFKKGRKKRGTRLFYHGPYNRITFLAGSALAVISKKLFKPGYGECLEIEIWDYEKKAKIFKVPLKGRIRIADYSLDESKSVLYVLYGDGLVIGWNARTMNAVFEYSFHSSIDFYGQSIWEFSAIEPSVGEKKRIRQSMSDEEFENKRFEYNQGIAGIICYSNGFLFATISGKDQYGKEIRSLNIATMKESVVKESAPLVLSSLNGALLYDKKLDLLILISRYLCTWHAHNVSESPSVWKCPFPINKAVLCSNHRIAFLGLNNLLVKNLKEKDLRVSVVLPEDGQDILFIEKEDLIVIRGESDTIYFYDVDHLSLVYSFACSDYSNKKKREKRNRCFCLSPLGHIIVDGWVFEYPSMEEIYSSVLEQFKYNRLNENELIPRSEYLGGQLLV